ncbi:hypothetical protein GOP47_0028386 [Adiantum capillus-veneris]|nr:hypothetical protein GOP47_0028386 [Adiantum capillus-veneris]
MHLLASFMCSFQGTHGLKFDKGIEVEGLTVAWTESRSSPGRKESRTEEEKGSCCAIITDALLRATLFTQMECLWEYFQ